ncbi:ribosomal biogenesis factor [Ambystoma mexicanum]|uniref:ribosomal biogenesis factor n=1 Tax=Ambystoma mexicanum TaxID=8296 RepID=UPI0037E6F8D8
MGTKHYPYETRMSSFPAASEAMAKNKTKGQKPKSVFHVANSKTLKAKNKAKPVTSNLKKINIMNNEKVKKVDKAFSEIHQAVKQLSKATSSEPQKKITSQPKEEPANVDETANLFSHL